MEYLFIIV